MTDNSSTSNNSDIPKKKNVSYTTDYMPEYLKDSNKAPTNNKSEQRNDSDNRSNRSNRSNESENFDDYIQDNKYTSDNKHSSSYHNSYSHSHHNSETNVKSSENGNGNRGESFFSKGYTSKTNNDNHHDEEQNREQEENSDYDNYNELSPEQQMLRKLDMLRKLGELAQYGVKLSQNYNMNSDYFTMKYEYQLHTNIRAKQNFINWTSSIMLNCIYGLEILNDKYDPFSLKLTNWSQQINADISSYYDVFGEIYEKYNKPGKSMSPELKLILMIGGSALKFHLNQVAAQGKLGIPPVFGLTNSANSNGMGQMPQPNYTPLNNQTNPQMMEQMRQQAIQQQAAQQMMEQTRAQNDILASKMKNEHDLVNQQVKDMAFLQQKKDELAKKETENFKKMQDFEKTKAMFEARNNNMIAQQQQMAQQQMAQQQFNQQNQSNIFNTLRREDVASHLEHMKKNISNMGMGINMGLSREQLERPAHEIYATQAGNVIRRTNTDSANSINQINKSSKSSKTSKSSKYSEDNHSEQESQSTQSTQITQSTQSTHSTQSDKSEKSDKSDKSDKSNKSEQSETSSSEPKKNSKIEKSLSSRNNYSTISKRRYKKSGITVDTS